MTMQTTTQVTQMQPEFENGTMVLGSVTVVVNFQEPQNYFGGQVVLTKDEDNISLTSTQDELRDLAIVKAKSMIASSELPRPYVPTPRPDEPAPQPDESATKDNAEGN